MTRALWLALAAASCGGRAEPHPFPAALAHRADPPVGQRSSIAPDRDGDRIPDDRDGCPTAAEDFDLHDDTDGCPDPDDDHDGIPDEQDTCYDTPGTPPNGCPAGCSAVVVNTDCFITAIWSPTMSAQTIAEMAQEFTANPEIEEVTLRAMRPPGEPRAVAAKRIEHARAALIAAGVPGPVLAAAPSIVESQASTGEVFGLVTKQRFAAGRFRELVCAGGMGEVYKVARPHHYDCRPRICGDGNCWDETEDSHSCPQDCPP